MNSKKFFDWCRAAVSLIKHWPQKDEIHKELYNHLEDRYTSLRESGFSHEESEEKALSIMGDAKEVAAQLAKSYKPIWPKLLIATRIGIVISALAALLVMLVFVRFDDIANITRIDLMHGGKATFSLRTNVTQCADGYTMTVKRVAYEPFMRDPGGSKTICTQDDLLLLDMVVTHPQIWLCPPTSLDFWAIDNEGNVYKNVGVYEERYDDETAAHTGLFQYTHQLSISNIDAQKLDWIELHCDRDGRALVWRIDLPGGDT